jgi:hypothetical protein
MSKPPDPGIYALTCKRVRVEPGKVAAITDYRREPDASRCVLVPRAGTAHGLNV